MNPFCIRNNAVNSLSHIYLLGVAESRAVELVVGLRGVGWSVLFLLQYQLASYWQQEWGRRFSHGAPVTWLLSSGLFLLFLPFFARSASVLGLRLQASSSSLGSCWLCTWSSRVSTAFSQANLLVWCWVSFVLSDKLKHPTRQNKREGIF